MAAPDYLQQIVVSSKRRAAGASRTYAGRFGFFRRRSVVTLIWVAIDLMTVIVACLLAECIRGTAQLRLYEGANSRLTQMAPPMVAFYIGLFATYLIFFLRTYGLYGTMQLKSGMHEARMTIQATLTAGLLLCGTLYLSRGTMVSRIVVMLVVLFTGVLLCVRRAIWRRVAYNRYRTGVETRNVLIIGAGRVAHALRNHLESLRHFGFRFKGFIALTEKEAESGNADVIGDLRNCLSLARSLFVDEIFFSVPADRKLVIGIVEEARALGIDVRVVPDLYDGLAWNASVEYIGQFPTIPLHRREFATGSFLLKRGLDTTISFLALLVGAPLMALIAMAIAIDSPGGVFYRAQRIGRKGRTFTCYKFRTMVRDADRMKADLEHMNERDGVLFKIVNDPRITRMGRFLRKYSLDELPQFYNVLRGDMSIVGPRPPMASEVEKYDLSHLRRLDVLPGITGLWQVEARQDPSFDSYISLDTAYVENWSLWLDMKILARTVSVVLSGTGA